MGKPDMTPEARTRLTGQFLEFHALNPHVFEHFSHFAFEVWDAGYVCYSANAIVERVRWHLNIETRGDDFKINNNWAPYYARLWMKRYGDDHPDFFQFRGGWTL